MGVGGMHIGAAAAIHVPVRLGPRGSLTPAVKTKGDSVLWSEKRKDPSSPCRIGPRWPAPLLGAVSIPQDRGVVRTRNLQQYSVRLVVALPTGSAEEGRPMRAAVESVSGKVGIWCSPGGLYGKPLMCHPSLKGHASMLELARKTACTSNTFMCCLCC